MLMPFFILLSGLVYVMRLSTEHLTLVSRNVNLVIIYQNMLNSTHFGKRFTVFVMLQYLDLQGVMWQPFYYACCSLVFHQTSHKVDAKLI